MPSLSDDWLARSRNSRASLGDGGTGDGAPALQPAASVPRTVRTGATRRRMARVIAPNITPPLRRANVDVGMEEVVRVVLRFQLFQARVIGTVRHGGRISGSVLLEVIHVASGPEVRFERLERAAAPVR